MKPIVRILEPVHDAVRKTLPASFWTGLKQTTLKEKDSASSNSAPDRPKPSAGTTIASNRLTRLIGCANAHSARIVGITGEKTGVGVSATARELAGAYARFGRGVLLVDASQVDSLPPADEETSEAAPSLVETSSPLQPNVSRVDLAALPVSSRRSEADVRALLNAAADTGVVVIVDLPPVLGDDDRSLAGLSIRGSACDIVFLVCLSGETTQKALKRCVETCEVAGVKLGGLILNDWMQPMSGFLEG